MNKLTASVVLLGLTTMETLTNAANLDKHRNKLAEINAVNELSQTQRPRKQFAED